MSNGYEDRTHCKNGHEYNDENTRHTKTGRVCRVCKRERKAKDRRDPEVGARRREYDRLWRQSARLSGLEDKRDVAKYDDKKTAVQRILGIKPEAMPAHEAMSEWFESNRSPCFEQPELYSDYDDPRYPEEQTGRPFPSTSQAEALCSDCPLRGDKGLCLEFALKNKEDFGVWGGKRIVAGRIYQGGSGRVKKEEK